MQVQSLQEDHVLAPNIESTLHSDCQNIKETQDTNNAGHSDYQNIK
jgi:hypothetical protein